MYLFQWCIENRLYHRTLTGKYQYFIILIPKSGSYPPRITYRKTLSTAGHSAYHVAPVPSTTRSLQHIRQVNMLFDSTVHIESFQTFLLILAIQMFHFPIQPMSHLFQQDISVGIPSRMLSFGGDVRKDFIHVGQIEITADGEVLHAPVVAPQERVYVGQPALSRGGVSQMPHVEFGGKFLAVCAYILKDFGDGGCTRSPFTEHIFLSGCCIQFHACQSGSFLPPVVLLFHQQIHFMESPQWGTILFLVIA